MKNSVTKKQKDFLTEIIDNRLTVEEAMKKGRINQITLRKWFSSQPFIIELAKRIECLVKRADMLISQHRLTAVERLLRLTDSEKEETARKACLDILKLTSSGKSTAKEPDMPSFSPQTAAKLLEILANNSET
jgi:translation elongation factor EF-Ts